jgi:type IV secretory pathway VirB2 component (pilin)
MTLTTTTNLRDDITTMIAGAAAWMCAIPAVQVAGRSVAKGGTGTKVGAVVAGVIIAYGTTPLLSYLFGWKTAHQKVRGIALALGTAQVIDGLVHIFQPSFYSNGHQEGIGCAGNIFLGAGLLGIFSTYA